MEYVFMFLIVLGGIVLAVSILYGGQQALTNGGHRSHNAFGDGFATDLVRMNGDTVSPTPTLQNAYMDNNVLFLTGGNSKASWTFPFQAGADKLEMTMNITMQDANIDQLLIQLGGDNGLMVIITHNVHKGHYNVSVDSLARDKHALSGTTFHVNDTPNFTLSIHMKPSRSKETAFDVSIGTNVVIYYIDDSEVTGDLSVHAALKSGSVQVDNVNLINVA